MSRFEDLDASEASLVHVALWKYRSISESPTLLNLLEEVGQQLDEKLGKEA